MFVLTTSLLPTFGSFKRQEEAILSWKRLGFQIQSINDISDEEKFLNNPCYKHYLQHGVTFIFTKNESREINGKTLPLIDSIIKHAAKTHYISILINSDIILTESSKITKLLQRVIEENCLCVVSRYNFDEDINVCEIEKFGLDTFIYPSSLISTIPPSTLTIGKPLWDYWIPFHFAINNLPIYSIHDRISFHKKHAKEWDMEDWLLMSTNYMRYPVLNDLKGKALSSMVRKTIIEKINIIAQI